MRVITESRLVKFWELHPDAETSLRLWRKRTRLARWQNFAELRQDIASADQVSKLTVFNISGNKYRLIARVDYNRQIIYIRTILTHAEYSRGDWKSDSWLKE